MHELYELKEMLCKALKDYGKKSDLSNQGLEVVDKLAHAVKNIDKIIEKYEEEEGQSMDSGYSRGRSYRGSYEGSYEGEGGMSNRGSYARGRGRYARRDSRGRYSRDGYSREEGKEEIVSQLRSMMNEVDDEQIKSAIRRALQEVED